MTSSPDPSLSPTARPNSPRSELAEPSAQQARGRVPYRWATKPVGI